MADSNYEQQEQDYRRPWYEAHLRRFQLDREAVEAQTQWHSTAKFFEFMTGRDLPRAPSERSETSLNQIRDIDEDYERFEQVARWWEKHKPILLDPVLVERFEFRLGFWDESSREWDSESRPALVANAWALNSVAQHIGHSLLGEVAELLEREVTLAIPKPGQPRWDLQVHWSVPEQYGGSLMVLINNLGATICLRPGIGPPDRYGGKGTEKRWYGELIETMSEWEKPDDFEVINVSGGDYGEDHNLYGRMGSFVYGKWYDKEELKDLDLRSELQTVVPQLRPALDKWMDLYSGVIRPPNGNRPTKPQPPGTMEQLAKKLFVDRGFLEEVVGLLEDKGQVIFYGPPGTGKTFLAKRLAEWLAPDDSRRALVQFHPSMSYEDFFEGYRPQTGDAGAMTYKLTSGPLRRIARRAARNLDDRHVMIIDEINRANLPKVLGELLFLLEYRDDTVLPLYRPAEPFGLPPNLWFIGTMNTADRSIALIDAALRRRFHFVPFFPHQGPMEGLLERWLRANSEKQWVGDLVAKVNGKLSELLGGPHLQLGHSHFMKAGISDHRTGRLEMVWRYTVEPFIEEQFFDDPDRVREFRWEEVSKPYVTATSPPDASPADSQFDEDRDPEAD